MSGISPNVRAFLLRRMSGPHSGYPSIDIQRTFLCWAVRRMSGHLPDVRAFLFCRMSGLGPGCPAPLFLPLLLLCSSSALPCRMSGPLARMSSLPVHLHYNSHICAHTIYSPPPPRERVDYSLWKNPRTHFTLSLSHSSTPNLRSPRDLRALKRSCPIKW